MQQVIQSLEDAKAECNLRKFLILRPGIRHQLLHHICIVHIVCVDSGKSGLLSGIAVRAIKHMVRLSGNADNARDRRTGSAAPGQQLHQQMKVFI